MSTLSKSSLIKYLFYIVFVFVFVFVLQKLFPDLPDNVYPSLLSVMPLLLCLIVLDFISCPYSKLIGYVWLVWYFVGVANTLSSQIVLRSFYYDQSLISASVIYCLGVLSILIGLIISTKIFRTNESINLNFDLIFIEKIVFLFFPILWAISIYYTIGYFPLFSGENISNDIYNINYGPLYAYGSLIILSITYVWSEFLQSKKYKKRLLLLCIMILFIIISMVDGKRGFAMVSFASMFAISLKVVGWKKTFSKLPIYLITLISLYTGVLFIRTGWEVGSATGVYERLTYIGVEFRDFVYTVNSFEPGEIKNYSWFYSTMASLINGNLLSIFGFDKSTLVLLDSAHAWGDIWNGMFYTEVGIRTGLVSELWFAYGVFYAPILICYGVLSGYFIYKIKSTSSFRTIIYISSIYGVFLLSLISQSTFTFGLLPVFFYLYLFTLLFIGLGYGK
jgi:hypothetical protein